MLTNIVCELNDDKKCTSKYNISKNYPSQISSKSWFFHLVLKIANFKHYMTYMSDQFRKILTWKHVYWQGEGLQNPLGQKWPPGANVTPWGKSDPLSSTLFGTCFHARWLCFFSVFLFIFFEILLETYNNNIGNAWVLECY